jgi:signal transduction histidine kinase
VTRPVAIGVAAVLLLAGCGRPVPDDVLELREATRLLRAETTPPAPDDPAWEPTRFPQLWGPAIRRQTTAGWLRLPFTLAASPDELWAAYLPRIGQNVTLWLNGTVVGRSGRTEPPQSRNWNRPQLFTLAPGLLRAGENVLLVRLTTHAGAPGYLRTVFMGPLRSLQPVHRRQSWLQITLPEIVAAATFALGVLILLVAMQRRELPAHRWLGAALVLWSWTSIDAFVVDIPVTSHLREWSTASAQLWCAILFAIGFHRLLGRSLYRLEIGLVGVGIATCTALFLVPHLHFFTAMLASTAVTVGIAVYIGVLVARHGRDRGPDRRALAVPALITVLFAGHDVVAVVTGRAVAGVFLSPLIPMVAVVVTGWLMLSRLVESLRDAETLNRELEARVGAKHAELEQNYARLRELERDRAVAGERERIMHDMHDGMGGQLVSTLAMVEAGTADQTQITEALRAALDDLRIVIDSLDPYEQDLLGALATVRSRLAPRLARHGLAMRWLVSDLPPLDRFGPEMSLQAMRIVQEAITNAVKHAGAQTITVETGEAREDDDDGVFVEIRDDGGGLRDPVRPGRGLANMRRRADRLGGRVRVESDGQGTVVRLWIPRARPAA